MVLERLSKALYLCKISGDTCGIRMVVTPKKKLLILSFCSFTHFSEQEQENVFFAKSCPSKASRISMGYNEDAKR